MLKHQETIAKLTTKEKIALLTSLEAYSQPQINEKGVPCVTFSHFSENYLTAMELGVSFDKDLIRQIAEEELAEKKGGVSFLPPLNVRGFAMDGGFSEDPYLNTEMAKSYLEVVLSTGAIPVFYDFTVRSEDEMVSDADNRTLVEYFLRPFQMMKKAGVCVVAGDSDKQDLITTAASSQKNKIIYIDGIADDKNAFSLFDKGRVICLSAKSVLERAAEEYATMSVMVGKGRLSVNELKTAELSGEVISPEKIDEWVDKAIDFAFSCHDIVSTRATNKETSVAPSAETGASVEPVAETEATLTEETSSDSEKETTLETEETTAGSNENDASQDNDTPATDAEQSESNDTGDEIKESSDSDGVVAASEGQDAVISSDVLESTPGETTDPTEAITEEATVEETGDSVVPPEGDGINQEESAAETSATTDFLSEILPGQTNLQSAETESETETQSETVTDDSEEHRDDSQTDLFSIIGMSDSAQATTELSATETSSVTEQPKEPIEQSTNDNSGVSAILDTVSQPSPESEPVQTDLSAEKKQDHSLSLIAAQKSIVLLKNNEILPLIGGEISVVGRGAEEISSILAAYCSVVPVGTEKKVLLFLGNKVTEDDIKELKELRRAKNRIIAVLPSSYHGDIWFDKYCAALLLAPTHGKWAEALKDILFGFVSPSGRVAQSLYENVDEKMSEINEFRAAGGKIGPFVGYRRDNSEGKPAKYPFGYGLTYTTFAYSKLKMEYHTVTFFLENTGDKDGVETVQVYVGKKNSTIIRADKELKAVQKVFLKAHEKKKISVEIDTDDLTVFRDSDGAWQLEDGKYEVYVGSSSADIKLTGEMIITGKVFSSDGEKKYNYLTSVGNTVEEGYTFKNTEKKKKGVGGLITSIFGLLTGVGLILEGSLMYFDIHIGVGSAIAFISLIIGGIAINRMSQYKNALKQQPSKFDNVPTSDWDKLFSEVFVDKKQQTVDQPKSYVREEEYIENVDVSALCDTLIGYCAARSLEVSKETMSNFLAAMALSRLIVVKKTEKTAAFLSAVSDCLNGKTYSCSFPSGVKDIWDEMSISLTKNEKFSFLNLSFEEGEKQADLLRTYFHIPEGRGLVVLCNKDGVPIQETKALWIVVAAESGDNVLPLLAGATAFVDLEIKECEKGEPTEKASVTVKEFQKTTNELRQRFALDESSWKRIDQFEEYANRMTEYDLDNKENRALERYAAIRLLCGMQTIELLDGILAQILIPGYLAAFDASDRPTEDGVRQELDRIFGEDNLTESAKTLAYFLRTEAEE